MIAPISTNFPIAPCEHSNCNPQSVNGMPKDAQQPLDKKDQVHISDRAREQKDAQKKDSTLIREERNLADEDKREVEKLKQRDREVKAHERAHMASGAGVVMGGASYQYEHGPDGKMYAVGGEVKIDTSKENDPRATISKMQKVKRAALAPAQPSAQDRSVATKAAQIEAEARIELQEQKAKETEEENHQPEDSASSLGNASFNTFNTFSNSPPIGHNLSVVV